MREEHEMSSSKSVTVRYLHEDLHQGEPDGWILFNAPRPIYGHREWQGQFWHGVFYAAVNPKGERAEWMIRENAMLDAWVIRYYGEAEIEAHAKATADRYGYTLEHLMELASKKHLEESWLAQHGSVEVALDEFLKEALP